mmetsp:Transcript_27457/g.46063  ORF Transcript_27457/g.46063 Transcript_27457/m.46063 type:complete len:296 (+) Transcript_27457:47-934(+)
MMKEDERNEGRYRAESKGEKKKKREERMEWMKRSVMEVDVGCGLGHSEEEGNEDEDKEERGSEEGRGVAAAAATTAVAIVVLVVRGDFVRGDEETVVLEVDGGAKVVELVGGGLGGVDGAAEVVVEGRETLEGGGGVVREVIIVREDGVLGSLGEVAVEHDFAVAGDGLERGEDDVLERGDGGDGDLDVLVAEEVAHVGAAGPADKVEGGSELVALCGGDGVEVKGVGHEDVADKGDGPAEGSLSVDEVGDDEAVGVDGGVDEGGREGADLSVDDIAGLVDEVDVVDPTLVCQRH